MIMIQNRYRIAALVLFLALGATISQAQTPEIFFTVSMPEPHKHMLNVEMRINFPRLENPYVDLIMPVWTPGSYLIREYARHVQDFLVEDTEGKKGSWSKINKHTWRVAATGSKAYRISYRVYANEFTVRSSEVNESHAFLNPPGLFMYPDGYIQSLGLECSDGT
jgi:predicted metalloprotease with PDZ domain